MGKIKLILAITMLIAIIIAQFTYVNHINEQRSIINQELIETKQIINDIQSNLNTAKTELSTLRTSLHNMNTNYLITNVRINNISKDITQLEQIAIESNQISNDILNKVQ